MGINHEDAPIGEIHPIVNWVFDTVEDLHSFTGIVAKDFHKTAYVTEVEAYFSPVEIDLGTGDVRWIPHAGTSSSTNLSTEYTTEDVTVVSSTGTDAVISAATDLVAGVMVPAQVAKLAGIPVGPELAELIQDNIATFLQAGTNITLSYNDVANTLTINATGGGGAGVTNLSTTVTATTVVVVSDTGADATLVAATGSVAGLMLPAQVTKLAGVATGATANATDAQLRDRATHTGTQLSSTISDLNTRLGTTGNLGTLAQQHANAIAASGGAIDGTTIGSTTRAAGSFTDIDSNGVLTMSGVGGRIKGDLSSSTTSGRLLFQSIGVNSNSNIGVAPSGSASTASWAAYNNSDVDNSSRATLGCSSSGPYIESGYTGAATWLPLNFYNGGSIKFTVPVTGNAIDANGKISTTGGFVFPAFTVATVPSAAANPNVGIIVTNAAAGRRPYWSNGTDWRDAANVLLA